MQKQQELSSTTNSHLEKTKEFEEKYQEELKQEQEACEDKLKQFQKNALKQEENLLLEHTEKLKEYREGLEKKISDNVKYSSEYLNLKEKEKKACKMRYYKLANDYKESANSLGEEDKKNFNDKRKEYIDTLCEQLEEQQLKEREGLKQKLDREYQELVKRSEQRVNAFKRSYDLKRRQMQNEGNKTKTSLAKTLKK